MTTNLEHFKQIAEQDSDRICEYCPEPISNREKKMGAYSHYECWKDHVLAVRARGEHGKSYAERGEW